MVFITAVKGRNNSRNIQKEKIDYFFCQKRSPEWTHVTKLHTVTPKRGDTCSFFRGEAKRTGAWGCMNKARSCPTERLDATHTCKILCKSHTCIENLLRNWKQNSCCSVVLHLSLSDLPSVSAFLWGWHCIKSVVFFEDFSWHEVAGAQSVLGQMFPCYVHRAGQTYRKTQ